MNQKKYTGMNDDNGNDNDDDDDNDDVMSRYWLSFHCKKKKECIEAVSSLGRHYYIWKNESWYLCE